MSVTNTSNAYDTSNPEELLRLKRQEAAAMLQIVRAFHITALPDELINLVCETIRRQLGVRKLILVTNFNLAKVLHANFNFPDVAIEDLYILDTIHEVSPVNTDSPAILQEMGAEYVLPLGNQERPGGWFVIAEFADSEAEAENDLIFIETVGNMLIISLENIFFFQNKVKERELMLELEVASRIQKQSLPSRFEVSSRLDIHAINVAHYKVAGDFYELLPLSPHELVFCMGDVSGKGIPAALLVANIQANIRALFNSNTTLHQMIKRLHEAISTISSEEEFVTLFIGKLNLRKENIVYINAGHNPIYLIKKGEYIKELNKGCIPLGLLPLEDIEIGTEKFYPGDSLFLYTDGVVEEVNREGDLLGYDPIKKSLLENRELESREIIARILDLVWGHVKGEKKTLLSDDVSMMMLRFLH